MDESPRGAAYPPYAPVVLAPETAPPPGPSAAPAAAPAIALLAPLTGPRAELGDSLSRGARMALDPLQYPGVPPLDVRDTGGTADGARTAAQAAIAAGDVAILGPLTSAETQAAAPVAQAAGVPLLAFTNDAAQARAGVWILGVTPAQQIDRLAAVLRAQNRTRVAALLPEGDFGHSLSDALAVAAPANGLTLVDMRTHGADAASVLTALSTLSGAAAPLPSPAPAKTAAPLPAFPTIVAPAPADPPPPRPPLPFDTLLLGDSGPALGAVIKALPQAGIDRTVVRLVGPSLWAAPHSGAAALTGAWYAAPDPSVRSAFATKYEALAQHAPHPVADLAYDAATLVRTTPPGSLPGATLTGVDGPMALRPDGTVARGLAVFEITRGPPRLIAPASPSQAAPPAPPPS